MMTAVEAGSKPTARSACGAPSDGKRRPLERAEFASRFREAWPVLRAIAAAVLGTSAGADDVVQEATVIALRKLGDFDANTCFEAWMGQIVRFTALNTARQRRRSPFIPTPHEVLASQNGRVDSIGSELVPVDLTSGTLEAIEESLGDPLLAALQTLEETARICLLLRVLFDMPYREISVILGVPEGTAMSHVHRSRLHLREKLTLEEAQDNSNAGGKRSS